MSDRLEALKGFVEEAPDNPFPLYGMAMECRRLGQPQDAAKAFVRLRECFPEYVPQYLMHGQLLEAEEDLTGARLSYELGLGHAAKQGDDHAEMELRAALDALD